jgi:hypothetical protein
VTLFLTAVAACSGGGSEPATERDYDTDNFSDKSTEIDNTWFPLTPGTQFVYEGRANRGGGVLPHRVVFTVTDLTKVIDGVRTVVMWDRDINEGVLSEQEVTFHAQDDDGNVWNFGEYPEEYENGEFVGAPSTWLAGNGRSQAGILMRAEPRTGETGYLQGWAPEVEFRDRAFVSRTGQKKCVPHKCYEDLLVVDETSPLEPADGHQLKYYARGVGNVLVEPRGGTEQETLVLVDVVTLDSKELAEARKAALALDKRAYKVVPDVFEGSEPAKRTLPVEKTA